VTKYFILVLLVVRPHARGDLLNQAEQVPPQHILQSPVSSAVVTAVAMLPDRLRDQFRGKVLHVRQQGLWLQEFPVTAGRRRRLEPCNVASLRKGSRQQSDARC